MAPRYTPIVDPYPAFAQAMKHITQVCLSTPLLSRLSRRTDFLVIDNNSLRYKVDAMKKTIAFKTSLNRGLDKECKAKKSELEVQANRVKDLTEELAKERDASKAWSAEKAILQLERVKVDKANKSFETLDQAKRDAEVALSSAVAQADVARIQFANDTMRAFLNSPTYIAKVGHECTAYLFTIINESPIKYSELMVLFTGEKVKRPDWFGNLSFGMPTTPAEEVAFR
ncbi:hypothetical protein LIER_30262 [Lithospermum erythrorhizon]|uniref:Kinetochore protein SPC25 n=1 Tax=Lithospermum erythrorhizon TaxID=34254 RepID=A0AAV3RQL9_LITER